MSHSVAGTPFFYANACKHNGGATYSFASEPGNLLFTVANDLAAQPIEITSNSAGYQGGAVFVGSAATGNHSKILSAAFYNANMHYNIGNFGAIAVETTGSGNPSANARSISSTCRPA